MKENLFKVARTRFNQHGKQSVKTVSEQTGINRTLIDELEVNDGRKPRNVGYLTVTQLAKHYGVSADYLLGLSPNPTNDADIQTTIKTTGLSQKAVEYLQQTAHTVPAYSLILSQFLESTTKIDLMLNCISTSFNMLDNAAKREVQMEEIMQRNDYHQDAEELLDFILGKRTDRPEIEKANSTLENVGMVGVPYKDAELAYRQWAVNQFSSLLADITERRMQEMKEAIKHGQP